MVLKSSIGSRRRLRDRLIVAAVSILIFIPGAELALRISCSYCTWNEQNEGRFVSPYSMRRDSWYHIRPPNTVSSYQQAEFDFEVSTNSLGFRDIEHPASKAPGEVRILAIGDSFTEGQGARFEHTWLSELGRNLNAIETGHDFTVMCGGAGGSDPFFGYRILIDKLLLYQPDFVLLVVNHSDVIDVIRRGGMERFLPDGTVKGIDPPGISWLYESSHLARFILFELFDYTHLIISRAERHEKAQKALRDIMDLVLTYNTQLAARGIDFTLIIHPFRNELKRNRYDYLRASRDLASQNGIDIIDVKPYLHGKLVQHGNSLDELYWPRDRHFTELGYRYFAEAVEADLRTKLERLSARPNLRLP